jgi:precorrin-6B methylase 2
MNLFFRTTTVESQRNGKITVLFSPSEGPTVLVDGYQQSGRHLADVWRRSLWHVPEEHPVKQVLLLGLGSGSSMRVIKNRFPDAHVTAVEWDPAMVELAKNLKRYPARQAPEIILGDACEVVPKLNRRFDVILIDLFRGGDTEPRLASDAMIAALSRALEPDGYLILNIFRTVSLIPAFERHLSRHATLFFKRDTLALFRHYGQGRVGDPLPEGYVHPTQSPLYLIGGWEPKAANMEPVGQAGCLGMRWHYGPIWIESYTSDLPPEIDPGAPSRMVIWQPLTKTGRPAHWHRSWIQMNPQQHGFADIRGKLEYWRDWTDHAQRHRKRWLKDDRFEIVEVTLPEFAAAYHRSGKLRTMRKDFIRLLERRLHWHGTAVHMFAARNILTQEIIAGLGVVDLPDVSHSMHLVAFIHPKFEKTSVGTGLIDHWFQHCQAAGIRFPHFGLVWTPGDPRGWKGYSKFKRQFNLHLLLYPRPLIRFVRRRSKEETRNSKEERRSKIED